MRNVSQARSGARWCLVLCLALGSIPAWTGAVAHAQNESLDPTQAEALALFRRGVELGEQDRWADALEHFRRSRALADRPNTVFNIGFALYRLGRFTQAIVAFDEYLAMTPNQPSERRDEAARLRGESVASLAEVRLEVRPASARVLLDGEALEARPDGVHVLRLDPGRHVVRASAAEHDEGTLTISVLAGEIGERTLELTATAQDPDPLPDDRPPPGGGGGSVFEEPLFWILAGVVVVGAGVGIGVGVALGQDSGPYNGSTGVVIEALRF